MNKITLTNPSLSVLTLPVSMRRIVWSIPIAACTHTSSFKLLSLVGVMTECSELWPNRPPCPCPQVKTCPDWSTKTEWNLFMTTHFMLQLFSFRKWSSSSGNGIFRWFFWPAFQLITWSETVFVKSNEIKLINYPRCNCSWCPIRTLPHIWRALLSE